MKLIILDAAERDLAESVWHYESKQSGLGLRFRDEVERGLNWLLEHPEAAPLRRGSYRRINLQVFPHYIVYLIRQETIWVVAIAHGHRLPEFWLGRI